MVALKLKDKEKIKIASNYITSDFLGLKKTNLNIKLPEINNFVELIEMISQNQISSRSAKDILAMIVIEDNSPMEIAKAKDLLQKNDEGQLKEIVLKIIGNNPKIIETYKSGKENAIMSLVGQVMKETNGSANPQLVLKLLKGLI
jgi:aspartyl-tRNA(Asn)/glutamyl-tRNA(Gln) amidotransferase subunit B